MSRQKSTIKAGCTMRIFGKTMLRFVPVHFNSSSHFSEAKPPFKKKKTRESEHLSVINPCLKCLIFPYFIYPPPFVLAGREKTSGIQSWCEEGRVRLIHGGNTTGMGTVNHHFVRPKWSNRVRICYLFPTLLCLKKWTPPLVYGLTTAVKVQ
jgi:hypothetical protein